MYRSCASGSSGNPARGGGVTAGEGAHAEGERGWGGVDVTSALVRRKAKERSGSAGGLVPTRFLRDGPLERTERGRGLGR